MEREVGEMVEADGPAFVFLESPGTKSLPKGADQTRYRRRAPEDAWGFPSLHYKGRWGGGRWLLTDGPAYVCLVSPSTKSLPKGADQTGYRRRAPGDACGFPSLRCQGRIDNVVLIVSVTVEQVT